jgi:hypothetical protein
MRRKIMGIFLCTLLAAGVWVLPAAHISSLQAETIVPAQLDRSNIPSGETETTRQTESTTLAPILPLQLDGADSLFFQRPFRLDENWIFHNSTDYPSPGMKCYENFWSVNGDICKIYWWGVAVGANMANCNPGSIEFEITFYSDPPGDHTDMPPADVACSYTDIFPSYTYYGNYGGVYDCWLFSFDLDPCCVLGEGWVSIQAVESPSQCLFFWAGSPEGDAYAYQEYGYAIFNDLALILAGESWTDQKMHFPQLPDLVGWDVYATQPMMLGDDWQCPKTGEVTGIHFWGSWKNQDQNTITDEVGTIELFKFGIWSNLPADHPQNPYSYSIPGELLWEREQWLEGTPYLPPTLEGWIDPATEAVLYNDHVPYWQYDFNDIPDPFVQLIDSVYWLTISAVLEDPQNFQWGWKNSRDHFMDDAVFRTSPTGEWEEMYEPPRKNEFSVAFDDQGIPEDLGSTNYFGAGWYFYPYELWWNIWFYDNPFTYVHPKVGTVEFTVEPVGPEPEVEFAINWSTDLWSLGEVTGRPPLPGEDEISYVGRQIIGQLDPFQGFFSFPINIPYNPEWVSVDFRAQNVIITGSIMHECVGTSLDLAFVITGEDLPFLCGDVDNDGTVNINDVIYILYFLFKNDPQPIPYLCVGDVNNDDEVDICDAVYLLNYIFKGGAEPDFNCCLPVWSSK